MNNRRPSKHYLDIVKTTDLHEDDSVAVWYAKEDFGVNAENVQSLSNPDNWLVPKPQIAVVPRINQAWNLSVVWQPICDGEFLPAFIDQCNFEASVPPTGYRRPLAELMYVKEPKARLEPRRMTPETNATLAALAGVKARYEELVAELARRFIVRSSRVIRVSVERNVATIDVE